MKVADFQIGDIVLVYLRDDVSHRICSRSYHTYAREVEGKVGWMTSNKDEMEIVSVERDEHSPDYFYDIFYNNSQEEAFYFPRLKTPAVVEVMEHIEDQIITGYPGQRLDDYSIEKAVAEQISRFKTNWRAWPINQEVIHKVKHTQTHTESICTISWYKKDKPESEWI